MEYGGGERWICERHAKTCEKFRYESLLRDTLKKSYIERGWKNFVKEKLKCGEENWTRVEKLKASLNFHVVYEIFKQNFIINDFLTKIRSFKFICENYLNLRVLILISELLTKI